MVVGGEGGGGVLEGKGMGGGQLLELLNMFSAYMARINFRKHTLFQSKILGPVGQSIVSLTSSLRGQLVKCFMTL